MFSSTCGVGLNTSKCNSVSPPTCPLPRVVSPCARGGVRFLNKLDAAISTSPFLEDITLVDTPGVLSGEMRRHERAYDFADVSMLIPPGTRPLSPAVVG